MNPSGIKTVVILSFSLILIICGCSDPDQAKTEKAQETFSPLMGIWQKIGDGKKQISDVDVKMMISEHTLIMEAPGCLITGSYTAVDGVLTFTITSIEGQRCASGQAVGRTDSVHYALTGSQLTLIPMLAGEERKLVYQRVGESRR